MSYLSFYTTWKHDLFLQNDLNGTKKLVLGTSFCMKAWVEFFIQLGFLAVNYGKS